MYMKNLLKYFLSAITAFIIIVIAIYWKNDIDLNELKDKYAYPSSSFISIDGINVHYRDVGKGEAILLIH